MSRRRDRDELELAQTEVRQLRARLDDPTDAERVAQRTSEELARQEARAGQLTRELQPLRVAVEDARLRAMEAKRKIHETQLIGNWALEGRLVALVAVLGVGIFAGAELGHGLWRDILTPSLPWLFGVPASAMFLRELFEVGQKLSSHRDRDD